MNSKDYLLNRVSALEKLKHFTTVKNHSVQYIVSFTQLGLACFANGIQ
jgi:hypothetical protein